MEYLIPSRYWEHILNNSFIHNTELNDTKVTPFCAYFKRTYLKKMKFGFYEKLFQNHRRRICFLLKKSRKNKT